MKSLLTLALLCLFLGACSHPSNDTSTAPDLKEKSCIPESEIPGIVGGSRVSENSLLAKRVVLLLIGSADGIQACTGTPISDTVILTAAHCLKGVTEANKILAIFHTTITCESGFDKTSQTILASDFVQHHGYSKRPDATNDMALIKLSAPIPATYTISELYDGKSRLSSDEVTMAGYGVTSEKKDDSLYLRSVTKSFKRDVTDEDRSMNITFNQSDKRGVCSGDSGSAIFVESQGRLKILAVTSIVIRNDSGKDNSRDICHGSTRAMYIPAYSRWIKDSMAALK